MKAADPTHAYAQQVIKEIALKIALVIAGAILFNLIFWHEKISP